MLGRRISWALGGIALAAVCLLAPLAFDARIVLAILAVTMVWWIGEVLPLAVTGLTASLLLIVVAGHPTKEVFAAYFDPVIVLLLGGFALGVSLSRHGLDVTLASWVMRRAGTRPAAVLLAIMATTATFSMWISNTASTAIMLPIALGVLAANPGGSDNLARALVLGVAFSANIGGIATPIGTTANPLALRFLADAGAPITFLGWMVRTLPLAVLLILALWLVLLRVYPPGKTPLLAPSAPAATSPAQRRLMGVFALAVVLWLTTDLHGFSSSLVALFVMLLLFLTRLLGEGDIKEFGWPTLLLIGGGLALGEAIITAGLDDVFADAISDVVGSRSAVVAFGAIGVAAVLMTVVVSNTAAAVIMIPVTISLASEWGMPLQGITVLAAAALSLDFLVPVGTPPNAMAYGTGHVNVQQMAKAGAWVSLIGVALASTLAWWFW